jgi:hypothetical protein
MLTRSLAFNLLTHSGLRRRPYRVKSKRQKLARLFKKRGEFGSLVLTANDFFPQEEIENEN